MYITCTNACVKIINYAKFDNLKTGYAVLPALKINATYKKLSPVGKAGNVYASAFMNKLILKVKTRPLLVYIYDSNDGWINGAMGEVLGLKKTRKGEVIYVTVHFYNASVEHERKRFG